MKTTKFITKLLIVALFLASLNLSGLILSPNQVEASTVGAPVVLRGQDTYVDSAYPTLAVPDPNQTNKLIVSNTRSAYLRFDFTATAVSDIQEVSSAMLGLCHSTYNLTPNTVSHAVYMLVDDSWSDTTMTYDTRPTAEEVYIGSFFVQPATNTRIEYIDLAPFVNQALADSNDRKISIRIAHDLSQPYVTGIYYGSDENWFRPNLVVTPSVVGIPAPTPTPTPTPVPVVTVPEDVIYNARYEAEDAIYAPGTSTAEHANYSGYGFVDTNNVIGAYVEWRFNMPEAGPKYLSIIYAQNGGGPDRTAELKVNGAVVASLPFSVTHQWYAWQRETYPVSLIQGENIVRITATQGSGLANIDCLDVIGGPAPAQIPMPEATPVPTPIEPLPDPDYPIVPGLKGFGVNTNAGRGGVIIHVTNLNPTGIGSLRAACMDPRPRTIVFDVAGTIDLSGADIQIDKPYLTIAGQTAPNPGIQIKGGTMNVKTHDVFIQHIAFRVGNDLTDPNNPGSTYAPGVLANRDGFQITRTVGDVYNVVLDHISTAWSCDEALQIWNTGGYTNRGKLHDITVTNSLFTEPLRFAGRPDTDPNGPGYPNYPNGHDFGMLIGEGSTNISLIGNLQTNTQTRSPMIKAQTSSYISNNLIFNSWWNLSMVGTNDNEWAAAAPLTSTIDANAYIAGAGSPPTLQVLHFGMGKWYTEDPAASKLFFGSSNLLEGISAYDPAVTPAEFISTTIKPVIVPEHTPMPASEVEAYVKANAGSRPAFRDSVDQRAIAQLTARTGGYLNSPAEVGGWPVYASTHRVFVEPANPNADDDNDGYTNLEEVLQQMAAEVEFNVSAIEVSDGSVTIIPLISKDGLTGEVTAHVSDAAINKALAIAQADINGVKTVTIDIPRVEGASAYLTKFQPQSLCSDAANNIMIKTDLGIMTAQSNMFDPNDLAGKFSVDLKITPVTEPAHSGENADKKGHRPIIALAAFVDGTAAIWNNASALVTISVPYTLVKGEEMHMNNIVVWYIDGSGKIITVPRAEYNEETGRITFNVNKF